VGGRASAPRRAPTPLPSPPPTTHRAPFEAALQVARPQQAVDVHAAAGRAGRAWGGGGREGERVGGASHGRPPGRPSAPRQPLPPPRLITHRARCRRRRRRPRRTRARPPPRGRPPRRRSGRGRARRAAGSGTWCAGGGGRVGGAGMRRRVAPRGRAPPGRWCRSARARRCAARVRGGPGAERRAGECCAARCALSGAGHTQPLTGRLAAPPSRQRADQRVRCG